MTLYFNGDSSWTATNVTANMQTNGSVIITGTNSSTDESLTFTLAGYREGRKTYYIGIGTISGYSYGSSASYDSGYYLINANSGQIAITNYSVHTMDGSFDFLSNKIHLSGSFKAPIP